MVFDLLLEDNGLSIKVRALVGSGSSGSFISSSVAKKHNVKYTTLEEPLTYRLADSSPQDTYHSSTFLVSLLDTDHQEVMTFSHLDNLAHDVILGRNWLALSQTILNIVWFQKYTNNFFTFNNSSS